MDKNIEGGVKETGFFEEGTLTPAVSNYSTEDEKKSFRTD